MIMAQEEVKTTSLVEEKEVSSTEALDHSQSTSSSDPSSLPTKLNAQAPAFVPTRPPSISSAAAVVPPPPPPPPFHIYSPPTPPPPSGHFHVPIHRPHMIPVHPHQYLPVRNHHHHPHHHQYVPVQYANSQYHHQFKKVVSEEQPDLQSNGPDHSSKIDKNSLSDEVTLKLLNQVEYYFSDLNLATTDHLIRFINKDPEGYVPISVVASFKKIKAAINSNAQLAAILRNSSKLEVSEDGKKVRRRNPLTESDLEELQSRVVVAENLPEDHCHQNLMKIFSAVGNVNTIRTCPPQPSNGGAALSGRSAKVDGMDFSNKLHAYVEYESVQIAEKAVVELNDGSNWRNGLKVQLMLKHVPKGPQTQGRKGQDGLAQSEEDEVSTSEQPPIEKENDEVPQPYDTRLHELPGEDHANDKEGAQRKGRNRGRGKGRGRRQYHHHHNNRGNHVGTSPSNNVTGGEQPNIVKQQPPGPRMPDGTRGFSIGRGKPLAVSNS